MYISFHIRQFHMSGRFHVASFCWKHFYLTFVCWKVQLQGPNSLACVLKIFSVLSVKKSYELIPGKNSFHFQVCQCRIFRKDSWPRKLNSLWLCRCQERAYFSEQNYETEEFFFLWNIFSSCSQYLCKFEFLMYVLVSLFFVTLWYCFFFFNSPGAILYKEKWKVPLQSPTL